MATSLSLENDSSLAQGYIKVNGSTAATLTTSGITGNLIGNVTGSLTQGGSLTLRTAQTASGTAVDFTGIPNWVKRISLLFNKTSITGSSSILVQLGTSGGIDSSNYESQASIVNVNVATINSTSGFVVRDDEPASRISGIITIANVSENIWVESGTLSNIGGVASVQMVAGVKELSSNLNRIRITTGNGIDTFDAGTINISYEG